MDMKKILQALDTTAKQPVQNANDMKKFMTIVTEGVNRQTVAEQMITQEYSKPTTKKGNGAIHKYIDTVLKENEEKVLEKKARAQAAAQRVLARMEEAKQAESPKPRNFVAKNAKTAGAGVHKDAKKAAKEVRGQKHKSKEMAEGLPQTLRKVVPGYAKREIDKKIDAEKFGRTDVDRDANYYRYKKIQDKIKNKEMAEGLLGDLFGPGTNDQIEQLKAMLANPKYANNPQWKAQLEKRLKIAQDRQDLDYGMAVDKRGEPLKVLPPDQYKGNLDEGDEDPCWADYKMVGTKKKGGKTVPNCVPKKKG